MNPLGPTNLGNSLANFPACSQKTYRGCGRSYLGGYTAIWCEECRAKITTERGKHVAKGRAVDPPMEGEWRCPRFAELDRLI
ncbi:MAG: hypothetical protein GWP08_18595, partial [Nitrospiraceae bacterium]|nr:hypothetical protein [Nitrospiraceae bacterium]